MPTTGLPTVPRLVANDGERIGRRAPGRTTNALSGREREYLTPGEVDRLVKTARSRGRYGQRDGLAILMCFRHGLRASELCGLRLEPDRLHNPAAHRAPPQRLAR